MNEEKKTRKMKRPALASTSKKKCKRGGSTKEEEKKVKKVMYTPTRDTLPPSLPSPTIKIKKTLRGGKIYICHSCAFVSLFFFKAFEGGENYPHYSPLNPSVLVIVFFFFFFLFLLQW